MPKQKTQTIIIKRPQKYAVPAMRQKVIIQTRSRTQDGQGGFSESWANSATVWAYVSPYKGPARFQADRVEIPLTHKIIIRYNATLTTAGRIIWGSRTFIVKEIINPEERNAFLELNCIEKNA